MDRKDHGRISVVQTIPGEDQRWTPGKGRISVGHRDKGRINVGQTGPGEDQPWTGNRQQDQKRRTEDRQNLKENLDCRTKKIIMEDQ